VLILDLLNQAAPQHVFGESDSSSLLWPLSNLVLGLHDSEGVQYQYLVLFLK